jgi:hypothetical protein
MKNLILVAIFALSSLSLFSQENMITLSSGYVFTNIEDYDTDAKGWRINGLYEFNPMGQIFAHGLSVGYIGTTANYTSGVSSSDYKLNSFPIYYAPKVMFGNDKVKGFVKGALGMHFSNYHRTGALGELKTNDTGFYGGAGLGGTYFINEMIFISAEYEWAYLGNSWYNDGFMNTISGGVGIKF